MATIFELASFVDTLSELAIQSEVCNARPRVWTQARKQANNGFHDPPLFYDSVSSDMRDNAASELEQERARALAAQVQLCDALNKIQNMPSAPEGGPAASRSVVARGGERG
ncbi:hypothetical protein AB1Y20_006746 [Prymnesium parvum]|uniref:Uncharacterized protein n=1 Tax=Prymnesium parvum TaxID=97485 RepID=A0AB34IZ96_PRYPA